MTKRHAIVLLIWILGTVPAAMVAQDAKTIIFNASKAIGADNLQTLQFSAMGSHAVTIGQSINSRTGWSVVRVKNYTYEADFSATRSHAHFTSIQNGVEQGVDQYLSADSPWSSRFDFWLSPYAFLKAAAANDVALRTETVEGTHYNVVTVTLQNKYRLVGYIDEHNLIERVQTWIDNDVMGDMAAEAWYNTYKDFGGVKIPTTIVEKQAGFPVMILEVSDAKANSALTIPPPIAAATAGAPQTLSVQSEKVADGVFYLKGGTHHSVAVELPDQVAIIDAPLNEQRSLAVLAEIRKLIPNKRVGYVINTHHHFDHSGGLRTYVDEGATIITHESNKEFFDRAMSAPRTLNPDRLARSGKKPVIETVAEKKAIADGTLEIHLIKDNPHSDGLLMVFLPKEKIVVEADAFSPGGAATNVKPALNLVDNLEKLKLNFDRVLPLHGTGVASRADLYAAVGKPVPDMEEILARSETPTGANGQRGQRGQAAAAANSDDRMKQMLETACVSCHDLNRVEGKKLAASDWRLIVGRMRDRGAELTDDDVAALTAYLAKTYGPDK